MKRLGNNGPQEVKNHPWLKDIQWDLLGDQTLQPPYKPSETDNFDVANSQSDWKDENEAQLGQCQELLQRESV